jgi:TetR/AcrR family transcriptional repressor of lmrAB and yxaGH operons
MLEASIDLMRQSGLSGAGINEIVRASGAPKGSVYHFFPAGKQQIATEALDAYAERVQGFIAEALARGATPEQKLWSLFDAFARRAEDARFERSCAIGAVSLDLTEEVAGLREVLARALASWTEAVAEQFGGEPQRARSFAGLVITAVEGAYVRARVERSSRAFREAGSWLAPLAAQTFRA